MTGLGLCQCMRLTERQSLKASSDEEKDKGTHELDLVVVVKLT